MNDKVTGVVLKINDYKENDLILYVITMDRSFLSFIAKGAKKINGKKHYYEMCEYEFIINYKDNKDIYSIKNSKLINSYYDDNDLNSITFKNIFLEMTLKFKELYEIEMYNNLLFVLKHFKENKFLLSCLYTSYLLKIAGLTPNVDNCVVCGNKKVVSISNSLGGFICLNHLNGGDTINVERLKKFRLINKASFANYDAIKDVEFDKNDFYLIANFLIENADINLKSLKMYKELFD